MFSQESNFYNKKYFKKHIIDTISMNLVLGSAADRNISGGHL